MLTEWRVRLAAWVASKIGGDEWVRSTLYFMALAEWVRDTQSLEAIDRIITEKDKEWALYGI
jgi:hypothetical protein